MSRKRKDIRHLHTTDNIRKVVIILFCLIISIIIFRFTFSTYETEVTGESDLSIAFYIVKADIQSATWELGKIVPVKNTNPYSYNFSISNFEVVDEETHRAEVNLTYVLTIKTTTNLPLDYELYKGSDQVTLTDSIRNDGTGGAYFRYLTAPEEAMSYTESKTVNYTLKVYFDDTLYSENRYKEEKYQDRIEGIEFIVDSKQVISEG